MDAKQIICNNILRFRKRGRMSQERLANEIGLTRATIINYEKGNSLPNSKILAEIARVLGVKLDDFFHDDLSAPIFKYRAHSSFKKNPQFISRIRRFSEEYSLLEEICNEPPYSPESTSCHNLKDNESRIRDVAILFRNRLGLGVSEPIANLFESVEAIGFKIIRKPIPLGKFFGLSGCSPEKGAFIFINTYNMTIERQIFTLAHEIGHLIFHRDNYKDTLLEKIDEAEEKTQEEVADYFAAHLLIPDIALKNALKTNKNRGQLKLQFRVSYLTLLRRLEEFGLVSFGEEIIRLRSYWRKNYGKSLRGDMEIDPKLDGKDFPENERFEFLVWEALRRGAISELKAAELCEITLSELHTWRKSKLEEQLV